MCGIAGIAGADQGELASLKPALGCMLDLMEHRGPDDRGEEDLPGALLGHLRLSILDLSARGHQPMSAGDGRYWITYNGEVYNFKEIRAELEHEGESFISQSDTEVILKAWLRWGEKCFNRFNGMWALGLYDRQTRRLLLSRDRVGIKPLYFMNLGDKAVFASEPKALLACRQMLGLPVELNDNSLNVYLQNGLVDGLDETFFKGIERFKPGHSMLIENGRVKYYRPYWDLAQEAAAKREGLSGLSQDEIAQRLFAVLGEAVGVHTRSDVPVGVCLSGGLDSSCVAGLAKDHIPGLKTFTSWFPEYENDDTYNELPHAEEINRRFGLESFKVGVGADDFLEKLARIVWYLDEPNLAYGVYSMWHVMEAASKEVTVVMDGQGGDELFAGYDFYAPTFLYGRLLENDFKGYQQTLAGYLANYGPDRVRDMGAQVRSSFLNRQAAGLPKVFKGVLDNFLYLEMMRTRLPALLRIEDRTSMAFSIESRVPLLDHRIIEFAFALDESFKIGPGWSKYVFRQALDHYLPAEITWRKDKKGYPTPLKPWADGCLKQPIRSLLTSGDSRIKSMIPREQMASFFRQWDQGVKNEWLLWRLLSLEIWARTYFSAINQAVRTAKAA